MLYKLLFDENYTVFNVGENSNKIILYINSKYNSKIFVETLLFANYLKVKTNALISFIFDVLFFLVILMLV